MESKKYKIGIITTHPIQYYSPLYRAISEHPKIDLKVYYCHKQSKEDQSKGGFGVEFDWDTPLFDGYKYQYLNNISKNPNVYSFFGCDTPEIYKIIEEEVFDAIIVYGWYLKSFWQTFIACWKTNTQIFIRSDSQLYTKWHKIKNFVKYPIYRSFIPKFDGYLSAGIKSEEYFKFYGADKEKIFFIPHCVNNEFFRTTAKKYKSNTVNIKKEFGLPPNSTVFIFVGKLIAKKNPVDFVNAIKIASKKNKLIYGLIVGDGELGNSIKNKIITEKIPVVLSGFLNQSELPKAYSISDCIILPSDVRETWGLVINEAMACGLPAIVSNEVGCSPDLIHEGITGETYDVGNVQELSGLILKYSNNIKLLKNMGMNSIKHISKYTIEEDVNGIINTIEISIQNKVQNS